MLSASTVPGPILPPKSDETVSTSVRLKKSALTELDQIASSEGYSRNELIAYAVDRYLSDYKTERGGSKPKKP